jgi:DHA1 family bicyclomycin/chloramphenicol resistance-like MFS transporter
MLCFAGIGSNFGAIAMEPLSHVAGTAASAQGFSQIILGSTLRALIGQSFDGTVLPMVTGFSLVAAALILVLIAEKGRLFRHGTAP